MTSNKNEKDKRKATTKSVITATASTKATISRRDELPQIQLTKMVKKREEHAEMALIDSTTSTKTDEDEIGQKKKTTAFGGISNPPPLPPPSSSSCASSRKKNMQEMAVSTTSHSPSSENALLLAQTSDTASDLDYKSLLDPPSFSSASLNNPPNAAHFLYRQQNRIENGN
jgi:hypothetical protein